MLGPLLGPELHEMIRDKNWDELREVISGWDPSDIASILTEIPDEDDVAIFRLLPRDVAGRVFSYLPRDHQENLLLSLTNDQARTVLQGMTPDDQARLLEELPAEVTRRVMATLAPAQLQAARDLLGYPPGTAGRYMTPRYVDLDPNFTAQQALDYVRRIGKGMETLSILYVLDGKGKLLKELRLGSLVLADPDVRLADIEERPTVSLLATAKREEVLRSFEKYDRVALPVTDREGHMLGIITADDVLDVAEEEATEDLQKFGGMEALDAPYLEVGFWQMLRRRGGWLTLLFGGEMLTTIPMSFLEKEIERAAVLMVFIPLIISSGGNSGSQASTLIVRSLALAELRMRDWWLVLLRELRSAATLGAWLGFLGFLRVAIWHHAGASDYQEHHLKIGLTIWLTLIGIVTFGSLSGSMLPFALKWARVDPATSSAPLVATLVDFTGLFIYFAAALLILRGTLL